MSSPPLYPPLFRPGSRLECHPTALGQCHCGPCYYPQPRHRSRLKTSIRQEAACPRKRNFHWSPPALSRWSSGCEHARSSLSLPTASIHSVNGGCSRAGYLDSSWSLAHILFLIPLGFSGVMDGQWNRPLTECPCSEPTTILAMMIYLHIISEKSWRKAKSDTKRSKHEKSMKKAK